MISSNGQTTDAVRVLRVFLASPSDLGPERRAARDAVNEINRTVARPAGFQIDLIGWEDTLSSAGRPQAIINEEMATCQIFIGMIWERWGTPPDVSSKFTSGFEEEFFTSYERYTQTGAPYMRLFFKSVDSSKLNDAGPELSKVIDFKNKRISEKKILFQTFDDTAGFAQHVRVGIADYILKLKSELQADNNASKSQTIVDEASATAAEGPSSPKSELALLDNLAAKLRAPDSNTVAPVEVARLRNLAVALSGSANDDTSLGAHDANLIYANRNELELSGREVSALADAGLDAITAENAPLFSWVASRLAAFPQWLAYATFVGPDARRVNVFKFMRLIRHDIGEVNATFSRNDILEIWFSEGSDTVKVAALKYLQDMARPAEVEHAEKELAAGNYATRQAAAETVIVLTLRDKGIAPTLSFLASDSFTIEPLILQSVLIGMSQLETPSLKAALSHSLPKIRVTALEILISRESINSTELSTLFNDSFLDVRKIALDTYVSLGESVDDKKAEEVLVRAKPSSLFNIGKSDEKEGTDELSAFKKSRRMMRATAELIADSESPTLGSEEAYFALCKREPRKYMDAVREHFDDRFVRFHEKLCSNFYQAYSSPDTLKTLSEIMTKHEKYRRQLWMREAADLITSQGDPADLPRIRSALDDGMLDPRVADITYLGAVGSFEDIARIDKVASDYRIGGSSGSILTTTYPRRAAAKAMLKLAAIPTILAESTKASFGKLPASQIVKLLNHQSADIRKVTALKMLRHQTISSIKDLLARYVGSDAHRFYNVIYWLDSAIAFPASVIRSLAERELDRVQ
jgi:hypothetical protein